MTYAPYRAPGAQPDARTRLLDATVAMSATVGLGAITVSDLCANAGLARRTFYRYFGDVRGAFHAASLGLHLELRSALGAAYDAAATPDQRARDCVDALIAFVRADRFRAEALFVEGPAGGVAVDALRAETVEWAVGLVMGEPIDDPAAAEHHPWTRPKDDTTHRLLSEMAVGGVTAMVRRQLLVGDLDALSAAIPHLVETLLLPYQWARQHA